MNNTEEIRAINIQLIAVFVTILSVGISIVLTYNEKLNLEGKEPLLNEETTLNLAIFNRILITILTIVFLYINYLFFILAKEKNKDIKTYIYQIIASVLALASALVSLYDVTQPKAEGVIDIENPII